MNGNAVDRNEFKHNEIYGFPQITGVYINHGDYNVVYNNIIKNNQTNGVLIETSAFRNEISYNIIYSNNIYGVHLDTRGDHSAWNLALHDYNYVRYNIIFGTNQDYGVYDYGGHWNYIYYNQIYNNDIHGVLLQGGISAATKCHPRIYNNSIYSNSQYGIYLECNNGVSESLVYNNIIFANQIGGIYCGYPSIETIRDNNIRNNNIYGIYLKGIAGDWYVYRNLIEKHQIGVYCDNLADGFWNPNLYLNTIKSNTYGICGRGSSTGMFFDEALWRNNIYDNTRYNISNINVNITNHWWGTTILTNIRKKIFSSGGQRYTSYRLFGPFDISSGADTTSPPIVTGFIKILTNGITTLIWNKSGDAHHYNIYASKISGFSNFTSADIVDKAATTNWSVTISGTNYIYITASDDHSIFTNESWYSTAVCLTNNSPAVPNIINANTVSYSRIDILWNDLYNETSYTLFRSLVNDTNTVTNIAGFYANNTNYSDTGLNPSTTYYYWIKAYNLFGQSVFSTVVSNTTLQPPPDIPTIIDIQAVSTNQISLEWSDSSNETSYTLYRSLNNDTNSLIVITGISANQTNYNDIGLSPNTYYHYWVKAYNGQSSLSYSLMASNITYPTSPDIVGIQAISSNQFNISWNQVTNVTSYTLFKSTNNNPGAALKLAGLSGSVTTYTDTGIEPDTMYYYWVKSFNLSGESLYSSVVSNILSLPSTPGGLIANAISGFQINLLWENVINETSYTLFRNTIKDTNTAVKVAGRSIDVTNYNNTGLNPSTLYYYWVRAYNILGGSGFSTVASNTTFFVPSRPGWLDGTTISVSQIDLIWENVSNETSYTLFRNTVNDTNTATNVAGTLPDITNYNDTGLNSGIIYYYWVKAYSPGGGSPFSPGIARATGGANNIFYDDFSTDKGWTGYGSTAEWERGSATVSGGCDGGSQDPGTDHSPSGDNFIVGNDIGGCYNNGVGSTFWLTSPVIDCTGFSNVQFSFWRLLGIENDSWDHVYVSVFNGIGWVQIWANGGTSIADAAWNPQSFDVSASADNNPNFQIRFGLDQEELDLLRMYGYLVKGEYGWNVDEDKFRKAVRTFRKQDQHLQKGMPADWQANL